MAESRRPPATGAGAISPRAYRSTILIRSSAQALSGHFCFRREAVTTGTVGFTASVPYLSGVG